jgi:hypothetical protein
MHFIYRNQAIILTIDPAIRLQVLSHNLSRPTVIRWIRIICGKPVSGPYNTPLINAIGAARTISICRIVLANLLPVSGRQKSLNIRRKEPQSTVHDSSFVQFSIHLRPLATTGIKDAIIGRSDLSNVHPF